MARFEQLILSAVRSQSVAASTATTFLEPTAAILANASGTLIGTLSGDSTATSFAVVQGVVYPLSFITIDSTNPTAVVALFNSHRQTRT